MTTPDPNTSFTRELGFLGHVWGPNLSALDNDLDDAVRTYINHPTAPPGATPEYHTDIEKLDVRAAALALIAGARHAAAKAREIELAAARYARLIDPPITVRRLADAAGISERAAATRYPNPLAALALGAEKGGRAKRPPTIPANLASPLIDLGEWTASSD